MILDIIPVFLHTIPVFLDTIPVLETFDIIPDRFWIFSDVIL